MWVGKLASTFDIVMSQWYQCDITLSYDKPFAQWFQLLVCSISWYVKIIGKTANHTGRICMAIHLHTRQFDFGMYLLTWESTHLNAAWDRHCMLHIPLFGIYLNTTHVCVHTQISPSVIRWAFHIVFSGNGRSIILRLPEEFLALVTRQRSCNTRSLFWSKTKHVYLFSVYISVVYLSLLLDYFIVVMRHNCINIKQRSAPFCPCNPCISQQWWSSLGMNKT